MELWNWLLHNSDVLRNICISFVSVVGLVLLFWRSHSNHTNARASVQQSTASLKQSQAALEQVKIAGEQLAAIKCQAEATSIQVTNIKKQHFLDNFSRSFELISNDDPLVRMGGIYTLERLANESEQNHKTIIKALAATLRHKAPVTEYPSAQDYHEYLHRNYPEDMKQALEGSPEHLNRWPEPAPDLQAMLTVIGKRNLSNEPYYLNIDLSRCCLRGYNFTSLYLKRTCLNNTEMSFGKFFGTNLEGASCFHSSFIGAYLNDANMGNLIGQFADFTGADFSGTNLDGAVLTMAKFERAVFTNTSARGSNLAGTSLTDAQLQGIITDDNTTLP